jgi:glucose/arabinose dehydrogenase
VNVVLSRPSGVVIGLDGAAYVTNNTFAPFGTGEVLRVSLD